MEFQNGQNAAGSQARRGESRSAIIDAAERLFLQRGFGSVSMDELAEAAGVARRTLYNQFASKEEIFRAMLLRVSGQLERAFPPGLETEGDGEHVLRLIAQMILKLHENPVYLSGIALDPQITATTDMATALAGAEAALNEQTVQGATNAFNAMKRRVELKDAASLELDLAASFID